MFKEMQQAEHAYIKAKKKNLNKIPNVNTLSLNWERTNSINVWKERNGPFIESVACN